MKNGEIASTLRKSKFSVSDVVKGILTGIRQGESKYGKFHTWYMNINGLPAKYIFNNSLVWAVARDLHIGAEIEITYHGKDNPDDKMSPHIFSLKCIKDHEAGELMADVINAQEKLDTSEEADGLTEEAEE